MQLTLRRIRRSRVSAARRRRARQIETEFRFVATETRVPRCKLLSTTYTYAIRERLQLRWALCNSPSTETPLTSDFVRVALCLSRYNALAFYPGGEARSDLRINYDAAGNANRRDGAASRAQSSNLK